MVDGGLLCAAGVVLLIVIVFMAVTSSGASEMVAISSLFTFDVYRRYIKPQVWTQLINAYPLTQCALSASCQHPSVSVSP